MGNTLNSDHLNPGQEGRAAASTGLIMGLLSMACLIGAMAGLPAITSLLVLVFGIMGAVECAKAKRLGFRGAVRPVAAVLSVIGILAGALLTLITILGVIVLYTAMG